MIDRIGNGKRMNVDAGFGQGFAHPGQRAGAILKKYRQLSRCFQGEDHFHLELKMTQAARSDNLTNSTLRSLAN